MLENHYDDVILLVKKAQKFIFDETLLSSVRTKGFADYVTAVDVAVEKYIKEGLAELYPGVQFLGEEEKTRIDFDQPLWILDPVDGTTNMMHHMRCSVISLALSVHAETIFAVVYNPFTDELFTAKKGEGAFLNGHRISVSDADKMDGSLIAVGTSPYNKSLAKETFPLFQSIFEQCADIRRFGVAALDCAYVACGRLDGYIERELKVWDMAAGILLVREAGGVVSAFDGSEISFTENKGIAAGGAAMHALLIKEVHKFIR